MPYVYPVVAAHSRVAGGQEHEVKYEAHKMGTSKNEVQKAVKEAGNSRGKVGRRLEEG